MELSNKDKIISSAIKLFSEKGFDGTSVDEIAKDCGVNKAMIYYYFSSKEGLLNSIIRKSVSEFSSIVDSLDLSKYSSFEEFIGDIISRSINYIDSRVEVIKVFFREGFIYGDKIGTTLIETISLVFDKVISKVSSVFNLSDSISFIDQSILINLVLGYINFKHFIVDSESAEILKEGYIKRVSEVVKFIISGVVA
ncbi:MAG: TetR/AcrR family transcriptional regulator [Brevinematia bacterium]